MPNTDTSRLVRLIIGELLKTEHRHLANIPSGGRGLHLDDEHVLLWSNQSVYRLIQGDWVEVPPESLPIATYIPHLRLALERRREMLNKRIARMTEQLDHIETVQDAIHAQCLVRLAKALEEAENTRQ
jgi:hypothetical protein